jgi:hypothetical protein
MPGRRSRATVARATESPDSSAAKREPVLPPAFWMALPYLVFAAFYVLTFKAWLLPFQDSGREIGVATRLAQGESLYRDVAYWFGPFPALLDALTLRSFGFHLDALVVLRLLIALLGVEALRRLARRLFDSPEGAACGVSAVVALCLFDSNGGSWAFPYSVAALEGLVGALWAIELALGSGGWRGSLTAVALASAAAGTKVELAPFALFGVAVALWLRRPRREAVVCAAISVAVGALFWLVPLALYGSDLLRSRGFLIALNMPAPLKLLYRWIALGYFSSGGDLLTQVLQSYLPGVLLVGVTLGLVRSFGGSSRVVSLLVLVLGAVAGWLPYNAGVHVFIPASVVIVATEAVRLLRKRLGKAPGDRSIALLAVGATMLSFFLRQPFFLMRHTPYSAFSGPLPLLISFSFVSRLLGARLVSAALLAGLTLGGSVSAARDWTADDRSWVRFSRGSLRLPAAEGRLIEGLVERLRRDTKEGAFVAGFPEPGAVLFFANRRNPFPWEQFNVGDQGAAAERQMIDDLETRRPEAAFIVNRSMREYGGRYFGEGYLDEFRRALTREMSVAEVIQRPPGPRTPAVRGDVAIYFRPGGRPPP